MTNVDAGRYLSGPFAPVAEEVTLTDLEVHGTLPGHLDGRFLRNGPNPFADTDPASYHWFLGEGMVHGLRLFDGRAAWYRNRWVRSAGVAAWLGEQPRPGPVHEGFDFAANTNVIGHGSRTFAIVEGGANPYELTDELETIGPCDFDGTLGGGFTAHPHADPGTGELHTVSYYWGWGNVVRYRVVDAAGRVRRTVEVPTTGQTMLHDCAITASSVVIFDLGVTFDLDAAASGAAFPYRWDPDYPSRVGLLPREGDAEDVRWFEVDPCYVFHTLNAFDDGDTVVIDLVRHDRVFATDLYGPNEGLTRMERWRLDRSNGSVATSVLADGGHEFPRGDERFTGEPHRVGYTVALSLGANDDADFTGTLVRHDLAQGTAISRDFGPGRTIGEFVFVPASADAAEGEGVVMGFVTDGDHDRTSLAVLDAATLESVAEVRLPVRVPMGFHGNWVPTAGTAPASGRPA